MAQVIVNGAPAGPLAGFAFIVTLSAPHIAVGWIWQWNG